MCLPKPGPRCSYHAHKAYASAQSELALNTDPDKESILKHKLESALWEYQTTPRGQNDIRRQAMFEEDPIKKAELEHLLSQAVMAREKQLEDYRAVRMRSPDREKSDTRIGQRRGTIALKAYVEWFGDEGDIELISEDTLQTPQGKFLVSGMKYTTRNIKHTPYKQENIDRETWKEVDDPEETLHYWKEFTQHMEQKGYTGIALTHQISEEVWFLDFNAASKALHVKYKLRPKFSGTNPWKKPITELQSALKETPLENLKFTHNTDGQLTSQLTAQLPKKHLTNGEILMQVAEKTEDGLVRYTPRRRSIPSPNSNTLMVEITAKDETYGSGVSEKFKHAVKEPEIDTENSEELGPEQEKQAENAATALDGPPKPLYIS